MGRLMPQRQLTSCRRGEMHSILRFSAKIYEIFKLKSDMKTLFEKSSETRIDEADSYERPDTIILSGTIPVPDIVY